MLLEFTRLPMPETSDLQRWNAGQTRSGFHPYHAELPREYQVPVIDSRSWMADRAFADSHHLPSRRHLPPPGGFSEMLSLLSCSSKYPDDLVVIGQAPEHEC